MIGGPRGHLGRVRSPLSAVRSAALAGGLACGTLLTACGSSGSGLASEPARQILQSSVRAMERSQSFYAIGHGPSGSTELSAALHLFNNGSFTGTLDDGGTTLDVVGIAAEMYVQAPAAFWLKGGLSSSVANELSGRYAELPMSASGNLDSYNYAKVAAQLADASGQISNDGSKSVDGRPTIQLALRNGSVTAYVYVAATGTPYPVEIVNLGGNGGTLMLEQWNQGSAPTAPANAVALPNT